MAVRVLLVEDDEDDYVICDDLLRSLNGKQFALTWAPTYEEGLRSILSSQFDVCLLDYRLGARSGLELIAEAARDPAEIQYVLLTGQGDRDVDLTAMKSGVADYLIKGELTSGLLERALRYAVDRRDRFQTLRDKIKEAEQQALILDMANDTIFIRDREDRITYWNQGAERLYGWNKEEAVGHVTHSLLKTKFPQPLGDIQAQLLEKDHWEGELVHSRRDGVLLTVASSWTVQRGESNRSVSILEVSKDITARKLIERQVGERTEELKAANKDLEEFAYIAAHDLKAPLRAIDNASRWLEEDLEEHLTGESRENLDLVRARVKRMEKLLDDLLEYARIGRTLDNRFFNTIPGNILMDDVLMLVALGEFTLRISPSFAGILVCRMPLQQILANLISNSIKHHDKKTGVIEVTVEDDGDRYVFAVRDDGPGIPAQFHDQIFKMFRKLRPTDQVEGSGMGLAMVRKSVEIFGGVLQLQSAEGQGSVFSFTWPKEQRVRTEAARTHG